MVTTATISLQSSGVYFPWLTYHTKFWRIFAFSVMLTDAHILRHTADKMTIKEIKYSIENLKNLNDLIVKCCTDKKRLRNLNLQTHLHFYVMQFDA